MKKWIFVVGIISCSLLFFISGTLVGYVTSEKVSQTAKESDKPTRKPSKNINPILGRIIQYQTSRVTSQAMVRTPTPSAVLRAQQYKSQLMGY